jgi:hypothetical protein
MLLQGKEGRLGLSEDVGVDLIKIDHKFNENVTVEDAYVIDKDNGGVLYHFMIFRHYKSEHHESKVLTHSPTHSLTYSLTYLLTYSLTYSLTHLLTQADGFNE